MPITYNLIASNTLSTPTASITFSAIPSTYTDLILRMTTRMTTGTFGEFSVRFNSDTSALYSSTVSQGNGTAATTYRNSANTSLNGFLNTEGSSQTGNAFSSNEMYIPSYTVSQNKVASSFSAAETNAASAYITFQAGLYRSNTAISSITIIDDINSRSFIGGSSFFLYGIKNS